MGRLFWKIFLWFWCATLLMGVGIAWGVAQYYRHSDDVTLSEIRRLLLVARIDTVAELLRRQGPAAAREQLRRRDQRVLVFAVDEEGNELLGRTLPPALRESHLRPEESHDEHWEEEEHEHWPERRIRGRDGRAYRIAAFLAEPAAEQVPRLMQAGGPRLVALRVGIGLGISALFCFWLAWYLTRPVHRLRQASRALADGALDSRVAGSIGRRRDEIADLGRDFDHMAARLQAQIEAQRRLLRDLSHELRSPLARLQMALGLARRQGGEAVAPQLDRIGRDLERMEALIGQMLALSRTEAQAGGAPARELDLAALLREVVQDAALEAAQRGCRIDCRAPDALRLRGHPELLRRALENLLRNAIRHAPANGSVEIRLEDPEGKVQLEVCDTGPGVPEEELGRIFEPFVRLDEARGHDSGGHGLGLAIARAAVLAHQGRIRARNRPGGGLCVAIELPGEEGAQPAATASPQKGL